MYRVVSSVSHHKLATVGERDTSHSGRAWVTYHSLGLQELLLVVGVSLPASSPGGLSSTTATMCLSRGEGEVEEVIQGHLLPTLSPDRGALRWQ